MADCSSTHLVKHITVITVSFALCHSPTMNFHFLHFVFIVGLPQAASQSQLTLEDQGVEKEWVTILHHLEQQLVFDDGTTPLPLTDQERNLLRYLDQALSVNPGSENPKPEVVTMTLEEELGQDATSNSAHEQDSLQIREDETSPAAYDSMNNNEVDDYNNGQLTTDTDQDAENYDYEDDDDDEGLDGKTDEQIDQVHIFLPKQFLTDFQQHFPNIARWLAHPPTTTTTEVEEQTTQLEPTMTLTATAELVPEEAQHTTGVNAADFD